MAGRPGRGIGLTSRARMARIIAIMARRQAYTLISARGVTRHLKAIDAKYDRLIHDQIEEPLRFEPGVETRNRKPLRPPAPFAPQWEIRFGPDNRFRVLYDIDEEQRAVQIVAIGEQVGNRLIVGGEEMDQ
jgi:mRNA-degrading endonuclease RelE of RelBE toxin-antitoxin system